MKIQPDAHNSVVLILENGDEFSIYTPNEKELVISRTENDKREYIVNTATLDINNSWVNIGKGWMIKITKGK